MLLKKLSLLALFTLLIVPTYTSDLTPHKCTHDDHEHPDPEIMNIEEDFNPEGNDHTGRTLASYNRLRTYGYYGLLSSASSSMRSYAQNDLFPPVLDYLSAALRVKYPVSGKFKVSDGTVCKTSTPSVLRNGVDADFVLFVKVDNSGSYVANSYTCSMAAGTNRPTVGQTTISSAFIKPTTDVLLHEKNMICMIHEVVHILGFATSMYPRFIDSNGRKLSGHIKSATVNGARSTVVAVEPLTSMLRSHFGCSSLTGGYMENSGSSATAGSHFERKIFGHELMTSGLIYQQQVSKFTLALLEGSGWYVADYDYADIYSWGQGKGCNFVTGKCNANSFDEFCSSSSRSCTNMGRGGGSCSSDGRSDGCKFVHASVNYDCDNSNADAYARLPNVEVYGRGKNSKCFSGTLSSGKSAGSQTTYCFKYTCNGSQLNVQIGGKTVSCDAEGRKLVDGYSGAINCPDPRTFCSTVGAKVCPRNCMGRGNCNNGVCSCYSGYKGADCAAP